MSPRAWISGLAAGVLSWLAIYGLAVGWQSLWQAAGRGDLPVLARSIAP